MEELFEVKASPIEGNGGFATRLIKKGEQICLMQGEEISVQELRRRYEAGKERGTDPLQVDRAAYIDMEARYVSINHSCEPNAAVVHWNELVALRDIQRGEEILYDYSATDWPNDEYWGGYDAWVMSCRCGASSCRKLITEWQYLPKEVQENFIRGGMVQDYILKKYRAEVAKLLLQ